MKLKDLKNQHRFKLRVDVAALKVGDVFEFHITQGTTKFFIIIRKNHQQVQVRDLFHYSNEPFDDYYDDYFHSTIPNCRVMNDEDIIRFLLQNLTAQALDRFDMADVEHAIMNIRKYRHDIPQLAVIEKSIEAQRKAE